MKLISKIFYFKNKVTLLLLLLLFFFTQSFSQTSTYNPFPDSNAIWAVKYEIKSCTTGYLCYNYFIFYINGDTIIENKIYNRISCYSGDSSQNPNWCESFYPQPRTGYIRNDNSDRKVYLYDLDSLKELLLYDFKLKLGDTLKGYFSRDVSSCSGTEFVLITDIYDSLFINGYYHRRIEANFNCFEWGYLAKYIDGIGSLFGPFEKQDNIFCSNAYYEQMEHQLNCFWENGELKYGNSETCDHLLTNAYKNLLENSTENLLIKQNPYSNDVEITIKSEFITSIEVYNSLGQKIFNNKTMNTNNINLPILLFKPGVYFFKFTSNNNNLYIKRFAVLSN